MNDILIIILFFSIYFSPVFYQLIIVVKERRKGNDIPFKKLKKIVKYSCLILLPLLVGFIILIRVNFLNYESPIPFDRVNEITFENFRGLEFFKKTLYGNKRFAYVVTSIDSKIESDYVLVQSFFHPSKSFVYSSDSNSKELLSHEIYHFKITELYTRKIKQDISTLDNPNKTRIKEIISLKKKEEREFQKKYDFDTFHSYVYSEQKKYERKIDSLLNLLIHFKEPKVYFK